MEFFNGEKQNLVRFEAAFNLFSQTRCLTHQNNYCFLWMPWFPGPCPHQSVPVEMDESMTSSNLDLVWPPPCEKCSEEREPSKGLQDEHGYQQTGKAALNQLKILESQYHHEPRKANHAFPKPRFINPTNSRQMTTPHPAGVWLHGDRKQVLLYKQNYPVSNSKSPLRYSQDHPVEDTESLDPPLPLKSDDNFTCCVPRPYSAAGMAGQCFIFKYFRCLVLLSSCAL